MDTGAPNPACQHRLVSNSALGNVSVCPHCDVVHLAIGHVSMRFTADAFRDLRELVTRAQATLELGSALEEHRAMRHPQHPEAPREPEPAATSFVMPPVGRIQ